ncbi:MAG TPA: glycoside hydrolase family 130 protein [Armatimonadota bacterium]|nr:glycoside hydrolase family 130 protein [Armatimonadota bacterium]
MILRAERFAENPLISPGQVRPSREGWEVVSTMNAGAIVCGGEVLLLVRVAERPRPETPGELVAPMLDAGVDPPTLRLLRVRKDDPDLVGGDPRLFTYRGQTYLTSISHLRLARSPDRRHFTVADQPALAPATWYEAYGVEDPRITALAGRYLVSYTAVSEHGIATALAATADFESFARRGLIFPPENRDVTIFPEKVNGRYVCHHRPVGHHIRALDLWAAYSPDLRHWGDHALVMSRRPDCWDSERIGGGAVPLRTERGWLAIYHGADAAQRYSLGAVLCDLERPERVLARTVEPLLQPQAPYEVEGFFGNVVFTCGAIVQGEALVIYYGAADQYVCGASLSLAELLEALSASPAT